MAPNQPSLQRTAFWGVIWSAVQSFSVQAVSFIIGLQLARLLSPDDYGLLGMLGIFTALAASFVDCGMGKALVQKQHCTDADYSTVFYFGLSVAVVMYTLLFISAPLIADFYGRPELVPLTRAVSIPLLISPFGSIPSTILYKELKVKKSSYVSIASTILSGLVGVCSAYMGCGVWALVYMGVSSSVFRLILLWIVCPWLPRLVFSWQSFKSLFGFGSRLLATGITGSVFDNLSPLLIGLLYTGNVLGYYTRALNYVSLPAHTATGVLTGIAFPLLCKFQHDDELLAEKYRLMLRLNAFVIFPLLIGLAALAEPCVIVLITEKWLPCVPLLQILCFSLMWYPIHAINLNLLLVKGQSTRYLYLEIARKAVFLVILLVTVPISVTAMCCGSVVCSFICLFINTYYTGKILRMGLGAQMMDILPSLLLSLAMGGMVWSLITFVPMCQILQLAVGVPAGIIFYIGLAFILRRPELTTACQLIRNNLRKS